MEEYVWISKLAHHPVFVSHAHTVLERAAAQQGVSVTIAGPDDTDSEAYLQAIRDAIDRRVAGIMLVGWEDPGTIALIAEAKQVGIPVVTTDADIPASARLAYVGTDWFRMGWAMAERMAQLVAERGKVLVIGMQTLSNIRTGIRGFLQRINDFPEIRILGPHDDLDVRFERARQIVSQHLAEHADLAGIAGFDGNSGPGAAIALVQADRAGKVKLVCVDADAPQLEHLRSGTIDAAYCQRRETFTFLAFQMLFAYNHGTVATGNRPGAINIPGNIDTGHIVVTRDNIDTFPGELNLDEAFERHRLAQQIGLLSSMIENTEEITLATDTAGLIVYANPAARRLYGYESGPMSEMSIEKLFLLSPDQRALADRCMQKGTPANFETLALKADRSAIPVQLSLSALRAGETVRGLVAVAVDISGRKSAEEALQASERDYRSLVESIADWIWSVDLNATVKFSNQAVFWMLGYEPEEIIGTNAFSHMFPQDRSKAMSMVRNAVEHGTGWKNVVIRWKHKDGSTRYLESTAHPIFDEDGQIVGLTGIDRNITERRKAEQERDRLAAAVEQTNQAIAITDTEGMIEYVNPAFETITGYSRDEALSKNIEVLQGGDFDPKLIADILATVSAGRVWAGRMTNRKKDGTVYEAEITISPLRDDQGRIIKYVSVITDVTEQVSLEQQLRQAQKMEAIGRLAGGLAHDFNNQLTVIKGYCELLLSELEGDDPTYVEIEEIRKAADRAAAMTSQLLIFSRKQALQAQVVNLNDILTDMADPLKRLIEENVELSLQLAGDLGAVETDPMQVRQAIMNLVVNARDAMPNGGKLMLSTSNDLLDDRYLAQHVDAHAGPHVVLSVVDTGAGMDEETRGRIFEPFFTTKPAGEGTGLGLSMVHGFVRQSGGHITVDSEPGKGTTFRIFLPQATAAATEPEPEQLPVAQLHGSETILIAEDDKAVRELMASYLRKHGYTVLEAGDAEQAIELGKHFPNPVDLLISDMVMPGVGGPELASHFRRERPGIAVLYVTGYASRVLDREELEANREDLLKKPFHPDELGQAVRTLIDRNVQEI